MSKRILLPPARAWSRALAACLLLGSAARAQVVQVLPAKDNTLFQPDTLGERSSALGPQVYAGRVGGVGGAVGLRRAVLAFDVASSVPPGSTVLAATLTITCSHVPVFDRNTTRTHRLRRATSDWGEGTSDAGVNNGTGAAPTPGDATWSHTAFPSSFWSSPGGDFVGTVSSSVGVTNTGTYVFPSTPQLVADVQAMLDNPSGNFGWVLSGEEAVSGAARAFDSREAPAYPLYGGVAPVLAVTYVQGVPTLGPASLVLLALLALGGGAWLLGRRT
ncbi:MAG TPA: IPTL-CTERM sorting domain-containing protein [Planctomycetota bacterium]